MRTNSKHIALEKIRVTLNLLRKSNLGISFQEQKNGSLIGQLKTLQDSLRYGSKDVVDPIEVLSPFLSLLRVPYLAGPFKLAALDSIQTFVSSDVLCQLPHRTGTALALVVDAIARCKFVQTDVIGDELVELHIIQTLNFIVKNPVRYFLEDETIWNIVDTCYNILLQTGGTSRSSTLYAASEQTLLDTVRFISVISPQRDTPIPSEQHANSRHPCAIKIFQFFIAVLQKYSSVEAQAKSKGLSRKLPSRTLLPLVESASDPETLELLISLKVLHSMLMSEGGNMALARKLIVGNAELAALVRDDLGRCLVMISTKRDFSPSILQSVLSLFGSLFVSLGPSLRVLVECFVKYVYVKALHQLLSLLSKHDEIAAGILHLDTAYGQVVGNPGTPHQPVIGFSTDELEMVLESLADLIADAGFLPSLFASYDCDPCAPDLVQPLVRYLCQCAHHAVTVDTVKVEQLRELNELAIHCFHQLVRTFSERCSENGVSDELTALRSTGSLSPPPSWSGMNTPRPDEENPSEPSKVTPDANVGATAGPTCEPLRGSDVDEISLSLFGLRQSKLLLSEASRLFTTKPEAGLRHLQQMGALPTPLTPRSVAKFLRIAQDIPKENVGSYLGELGKDSPKFEGDGKEFHKQVLLQYVLNFELSGQSILNCMRIFLSAFRLPGEAQQIDRILVAFSEYSHSQCIEGKSGLLENPEVTYLLTFSIIMLNTDRHNPNIRADRKMTIDQFVRNNTNYGVDVKQTLPIPRSFLEEVYRSISEFPIRTERNDISAEITPEVWMDMQLQAAIDPARGTLVCSSHPADLVKTLIGSFIVAVDGGNFARISDGEESEETASSHDATNVTLRLLTDQLPRDALGLSEVLHGSHWFVDTDLLTCIWQDLLQVGVSPFLAHRTLPSASSQAEGMSQRMSSTGTDLTQPQKCTGLQIGVDVLVLLVKIGLVHNISSLADLVVYILADFSGLLKVGVVDEVAAVCKFGFTLSPEPHSQSGLSSQGTKWRSLQFGAHTDNFFESVMYSIPARVALFALLRLVHCLPMHLGVSSWQLVWVSLGQLRDCALLPKQMVVDSDVDLLPAGARQEFEDRISAHELRTQAVSRPLVVEKKSASLLSLQGLGEAFFGSNPESVEVIETPTAAVSSRWDAGYEECQRMDADSMTGSADINAHSEFVPIASTYQTHGLLPLASEFSIPDSAYYTLSGDAASPTVHMSAMEIFFEKLRAIILECELSRLVADTRFLSENTLLNYYWSLVSVAEAASVSVIAPAVVISTISRSSSSTLIAAAKTAGSCQSEISNIIRKVVSLLPQCSSSSCAWMEMVIVDTSLRNRDRFALLWPILEAHYDRTLRRVQSFSYVNERRVTGFFKMATRMISRDQLSNPILELLSRIFTAPMNSSVDETASASSANLTNVLEEYSAQISAGVWHLLTLNISLLPTLRLEQWQVLFDVIAIAARGGGFSSIKTFEVMAWLLHEPRLRAEVPLFCIAALKPLIQNSKAPVSVSIGAIQLLGHLHTRLEVLVKIDDSTSHDSEDMEDADGDTPVLWESCWTPILRSLADGATDDRIPVRLAAVDALSNALLDGHVDAVPPGVLGEYFLSIVPAPSFTRPFLCVLQISNRTIIPHFLLHASPPVTSPPPPIPHHSPPLYLHIPDLLLPPSLPPPDLVRILGDIVIPMALFLSQSLVQTIIGNRQKKIGQRLEPGRIEAAINLKEESDLPVEESIALAASLGYSIVDRQSGEDSTSLQASSASPVERSLDCLCTSFLQQLPKLSRYPSFDNLWLRFLHVFGFFLGAPHGFDHDQILGQIESNGRSLDHEAEITAMVEFSRSNLSSLIAVLIRDGVFKERKGLWDVTRDSVDQMTACPNLLESIAI